MDKFWLQFPSAIRSVPREDFYRDHCKELTSYLLPGNRSPQLTGFTVVTLDGTFANGQWQVLGHPGGYYGTKNSTQAPPWIGHMGGTTGAAGPGQKTTVASFQVARLGALRRAKAPPIASSPSLEAGYYNPRGYYF